MAKFKIIIERSLCTGCGTCIDTCPEFWEMANDDLSHLKESKMKGDNEEREMEDAECNIEAAESCPAECIHVYENGAQIV